MAGILTRERIVAGPGFNRWLVPPAALAIHLSIGMAYGFSVFWLPLSRASASRPIPARDHELLQLGATDATGRSARWAGCSPCSSCSSDSSAALFGRWLERAGPRKSRRGGGVLLGRRVSRSRRSASTSIRSGCSGSGSGVIGGCGLGLGYISPVSTLIKWFPDRRGMATGMAIMGFGGGAMIGAPLADLLMKHFATPTSVGVWQTFVTMGVIYFVAMMAGAFGYRVPPPGWTVARRATAGPSPPSMQRSGRA